MGDQTINSTPKARTSWFQTAKTGPKGKAEIRLDAFSDIFEECRINKPPRQLYEVLCALPYGNIVIILCVK